MTEAPEPFQDPELLRRIVEASSDCVKVLDLGARLLTMNAGGMETMEIDDFSVCQNLLWPEFWQGEARAQVEAALNRARDGISTSFEGEAATFKGSPRWWAVKVSPILDSQGAVRQLLAVSRDITGRKQAEAALLELNMTLEAQVQARTHELAAQAQALNAFVTFTEAVGARADVLSLAQQAINTLQGQFTGASVGYYQSEGGLWKARAWSDDLPQETVAIITAGLSADVPIIAQGISAQQAIFTDGWDAREQGVPHSELYGAACVYPLIVEGELQGLLSVGLREARRWTEPERALVRAVGRGLTLSLERAHALQRLAERETDLRRERSFLSAVLQNMSEGVVACDVQGTLTLFNDATRSFHGLDASPLPPQEWAGHYDLFEGDGTTPMNTERVPLVRAWRGERLHEVEMVIRSRSGEARQLLASGQPMFTPQGEPLGAVVTMRDVTARRAAEQGLVHSNEQLLRSNAELLAANEELEAFAYSASHDLRTPVRHVKSFAELVRKALQTTPNAAAERHLEHIEEAATRMFTMIDAMLALSRSTRHELRYEAVDLGQLVAQAQREVAPELLERPVEWRIQALPVILGDRATLQQVMTHLVNNAVKFTRRCEQPVIEIWAEQSPDAWEVSVRDNGAGFDPAYQNKLFGVFQRLHGQQEFAGTGIGLATVRRIILRHGGQVSAQGQVGQGATFRFSLPQRKVASTRAQL